MHNIILKNRIVSKEKKLKIKGITDKNNKNLNKKFNFFSFICDENKSEKKILKCKQNKDKNYCCNNDIPRLKK